LSAKVLGISPDSVESHRRFHHAYLLKIDLSTGPDHKVMETYGAWQQSALSAGPVRSTVPVGFAGTLVHHWPKVIPEGHAERGGVKLAELRSRAPRSGS
jgi:peroxiredoxin Q/BCP